jgi:flagellar basal-body rod protein FlgF/flagellar basal-body rod protein FlgG
MLLRLENAAASMSEMQRHQERVANNLANADTVGYKRDRLFTTALNERMDVEGAPRSDRRFEQGHDASPGSFEETGNPLDVALEQGGFFVTQNEVTGAQRFTKAGHFVVDDEGTLRTTGGLQVMGDGGPIQLPVDSGGAVEISKSGVIRVGEQRVGTLRVVEFENPQQLRRAEGAAFAADGADPTEVETPTVLQGFVETSNVNPIAEMTDMIEHFRRFESQQKALRSADSMLQRATRDLGQL